MIASVHIADVGPAAAVGVIRRPPKPADVPGLRHANVAIAAPLSKSLLGTPQPGRVALIGFWDDDASLDRFLGDHPLADKLAGGWSARLEPLRMHGSWPGMPDDIPTSRSVDHDGPAVVLTMGWLRVSQALRFLRSSAKAEGAAIVAPGFTWGTGLARPPFVATCSLWESSNALSTYAYGRSDPGHPDAIHAGDVKPFHKQSAFIRFRPYQSTGNLEGKNPLTP